MYNAIRKCLNLLKFILNKTLILINEEIEENINIKDIYKL